MKKLILLLFLIFMDFINVNSKIFPIILSIRPDFASIGDIITIKGKNFGVKQDTNFVTIYGKNVIEYFSWSSDSIKVKIPPLDEVPDVKITVTIYGVRSNEYDFLINNEWTNVNLDVDHYRNGDLIPQVQDSVQWANLKPVPGVITIMTPLRELFMVNYTTGMQLRTFEN